MEGDSGQMENTLTQEEMLVSNRTYEVDVDCVKNREDIHAEGPQSDNINLVAEIMHLNEQSNLPNIVIQKSVLDSIVDSHMQGHPDLSDAIGTSPQDVEMFHLGVCESEVVIDHTEVVDTDANPTQDDANDLEHALHDKQSGHSNSPGKTSTCSFQKSDDFHSSSEEYVKVEVLPETAFSFYPENNPTDQPVNVAVNSNFTFDLENQHKNDAATEQIQVGKKRRKRKSSRSKKRRHGKQRITVRIKSNCVVDTNVSSTQRKHIDEGEQCSIDKSSGDEETPSVGGYAKCKADGRRGSNSKKAQKCKDCGRSYDKSYFAQHKKKCIKEKFQCPTCGKHLLTGKMLQRHVVSCGKEKSKVEVYDEESEEPGMFQCRVCPFVTTVSEIFNGHQKTHFVERCEKLSKKIYTCDKCSYRCTVEKALIAHAKSDSCGTAHTMVSCKICGNDFQDTDDLAAHILLHRVENGYMCDICGAEFFTTQKVIQHRRTHTNERPFRCDFCSYSCNREDNLQTHVKRKHRSEMEETTQAESNNTGVCRASARNTKSRAARQGKRNQNVADQKRLRKKTISQLTESFQANSGGKNGVYCVDRRRKPVKLSRHLSCKICQIEFTFLAKKNEHMEMHKSGDRYKCELCDFRVLSISKLVEHIRMHTGEKPNKCEYCDYRCAKRDNLLTHMKLKHCK